MKKFFLFFVIMFVTLLTSCISLQSAVYLAKEDDEINPTLRQGIGILNAQVLDGIQKADFDRFIGYFATGLTDKETLKQELQNNFPTMTKYTSGRIFTTYREYYVEWHGNGNTPAVISPRNDNDYNVTVNRAGDEMYFYFGVSSDFNQFLLTMIYVKQNDIWKLTNCYLGSFKVAEKNAMQWYQDAVAQYDKGYLIPALFRAQIASNCKQPSPLARYAAESRITDLTAKLQDEAKATYIFPIKLSTVKNEPVIYYIEPQFVQNEMIPIIRYVTTCRLSDYDALKEEANLMSPMVQDMFYGITAGASGIVFRAFSEPPTDSSKTYSYYSTVIEITK